MSGLSQAITETVIMALYQFEMMDKSMEVAVRSCGDMEEIKRQAVDKYQTDPLFHTKVHGLSQSVLATIDRQTDREEQQRFEAVRLLQGMVPQGWRKGIYFKTSIFSRKQMRFVET